MLVTAVRKFSGLSLLVCKAPCSTLLRQKAIVSSKVIEIIADESQNDPVVLADKLKLISPSYLQNRSRMEQLSQKEIEKCASMFENIELNGPSDQMISSAHPQTVNPYYFKHLFNVEGLSSATIQGVITKLENQNEGVLAAKLRQLAPHPSLENLSDESVNQIKQLMTTGVILPKYLKTQKRIKKGRNLEGLFTFQPTWMTTTYIFKYLRQRDVTQKFFYGSYGTGKSIAFILYCILMGNISKFAAQVPAQQIEQLVKSNTLLRPFKPFYWSFSQFEKQQDAKQNILEQCSQIYQGNLNLKKSLYKLPFQRVFSRIRRLYNNKNIQTLIIIDQINALAGMMRNFNKDNSSVDKSKLINFQYISKEITAVGDEVIYNSSANIQRELLEKSDKQNPLTLEIQTHSSLNKVYIPYEHRIKTEKGSKQCSNFLFFEAKIRNIELSDSEKSNLVEELNNIPYKKHLKPLTINQLLNSKNKKDFAKELMEKSKQSLDKYAKRFQKKIQQLSDTQIGVCGVFFFKIMELLRHNQSEDLFMISRQTMTKIQSELGIKVQKQKEFLDKNIFLQHGDGFESSLSPAFLYTFLTNNFFSSNFLRCIILVFQKFNINKQFQPVFGCIYQYHLLKSMQNKLSKNEAVGIRFGNHQILIKEVKKFIEFNQYKGQKNRSGHMDEILQATKKLSYGYYCLGLPVLGSNNQRSPNSFCVDFCLVKYNNSEDKFNILFFDIKTKKSITPGTKNLEAQDFKVRLKKSVGDIKHDVKIYVMCEQQALPAKYKPCPNIQFIDITAINIDNLLKQDEDILKYLLQKFQDSRDKKKLLQQQKKNEQKQNKDK